jgi:hypothetical protein
VASRVLDRMGKHVMSDSDLPWKTATRRCVAVARQLAVPEPFCLGEFRTCLEQHCRRAVRLVPLTTAPGAPSGVWVRARDADYLYYERLTSPFHQAHIVVHLAACMLLGERTGSAVDRRLVPDLSPQFVSLMLGPDTHNPVSHLEAEAFAFLVLDGAGQPPSRPMAMRSLRRLRALHDHVLRAAPEALGTTAVNEVPTLRARLHRSVVEIRDAALALRPYRDANVAAAAAVAAREAGLTGDVAAAEVEAAVLADAIRGRKAGRPSDSGPESIHPSAVGPDLRSEAAWLLKVSRAFTRLALNDGPEPNDSWASPRNSNGRCADADRGSLRKGRCS